MTSTSGDEDEVLRRVAGLDRASLGRWVALGWVRPPAAGGGGYREVDVARLRLIVELRDAMEVGESAMPVVLSLLDRLHEERRRMRRLCEALAAAGPEERARDLLDRLAAAMGGEDGR